MILDPQSVSQDSSAYFWGRLDPRIKMFCIFSLVIALSLTPFRHYIKFLSYFVLIFSLTLISRVRWRVFFLRIMFIVPMIVFLGFAVILFPSSLRGENTSFIILQTSVKMVLVFLTMGIWMLTVPFSQIISGIEAVRIPPMVVTMLHIMYRYIYLIFEEARRLIRSIKSRSCGNPRLWREWKVIQSIISVFLVRLVEKSGKIYIAMLSRGDITRFYSHAALKLKWYDFMFGIAFHCILAGILFLPQ